MTQPVADPDSPFLFITGLHRSGTSLVRDLISQHSKTSTLRDTGAVEDEGQFLQQVLPLPMLYGGPGRFAWRPEVRFTEADVARFVEPAQRMCDSWAPYWRGAGATFVEKSPANITRCRFLHRIFPNSRFVYVLRHPVACSYATQKWARLRPPPLVRNIPVAQIRQVPIAQLLRHWVRANTIAAADIGFMGGRAMFVRYEDLLADPAGAVETIERFAGLPSEVVDTSSVRASGNDKYLARWNARPDVRASAMRALLSSTAEICDILGYDIFADPSPS